MKILLLIDSLVSGGRERRLVELIKGFGNYPDVQLTLVIFSDKIHYQEIYDLGIPIKILVREPKRNPMVFFRLFKICKDWKPDLIHSWGTMSAIFAIPSSLLLRIKLINGNITDAPANMSFMDKRLLRAKLTFPFSRVVVGNSLAGLMAYRVPEQKGMCIYNGFDQNRISNLKNKAMVREQFKINSDKTIGMVATFSDLKDYGTYIRAALILLKKRKNVTFVAVGDGPTLKECIAMVPAECVAYFVFTGVQTDIESIVNVFDVGVLSTYTEGVSNAILEYMASGKPVVATFGGGTNEIVVEGRTGFLIPPKSPQLMADKIIYLLDNPKETKKIGQAGRARVLESFSLDTMTKAYLELYKSLIKAD